MRAQLRGWRLPVAMMMTLAFLAGHGHAEVSATDADGDRVPDRADRCLETPAGMRVSPDGCSVIELARGAHALMNAARFASARKAQTHIGAHPELEDQARRMSAALDAMEGVSGQLAEGKLCEGADAFDAALGSYRSALSRAAEIVGRLVPALRRGSPETNAHGDTDHDDMKVIMLESAIEYLGRADVKLTQAAGVVRTPCASIAGRNVSFRGHVSKLEEARGIGRLADGRVFALPTHLRSFAVWEGGDVSGQAMLLVDGSLWVEGMSMSIHHPVDTGLADLYAGPCLDLRVAPNQPFTPNAPVITHPDDGYERLGVLFLEQSMRLAVENRCSPVETNVPGTSLQSYTKRTAEITIRISRQDGTVVMEKPVAKSLEPGQDPVPLPPNSTGDLTTLDRHLVITERRQTCIPTGLGESSCSAPATIGTTATPTTILQTNGFCTAKYATTVFSIDDDDPNAYASGAVTGLHTKHVDQAVVTSLQFDAIGYRVTNGASSRPSLQAIAQGTPFAVYNDDFLDSWIAPGTDTRSGLMWPRIKGIAHSDPFWYSCRLPEIQRDAVTDCPEGMKDSYYRIPFAPGQWSVSQGNNGQPTHQGIGEYAFDFPAPLGTEIRAPRGGVVDRVVEDSDRNCFNVDDDTCKGNVLQIEHVDGSLGYYVHMPKNGILVSVGDVVHRGQVIALVGNTGNSSGPHLHFEVRGAADWNQSIEARFELIDADYVKRTCYIPGHNETFFSTNV